jgi:hypothetical protein
LKSPTVNELGESARIGAGIGEPGAFEKFTVVSGIATGKKTAFERPPPGAGLSTAIEAVPAMAMSEDGTVAVSWRLFTNVVASAAPLKLTVAPETKPVPFTVNMNPGPPGAAASGINGRLTKGTALPGGPLEKISMLKKDRPPKGLPRRSRGPRNTRCRHLWAFR